MAEQNPCVGLTTLECTNTSFTAQPESPQPPLQFLPQGPAYSHAQLRNLSVNGFLSSVGSTGYLMSMTGCGGGSGRGCGQIRPTHSLAVTFDFDILETGQTLASVSPSDVAYGRGLEH